MFTICFPCILLNAFYKSGKAKIIIINFRPRERLRGIHPLLICAKMMSDGDLLQLIKKNDTAAFESIYDKYWQALYLKACQRVDKDEAKDMVQEVMISLW